MVILDTEKYGDIESAQDERLREDGDCQEEEDVALLITSAIDATSQLKDLNPGPPSCRRKFWTKVVSRIAFTAVAVTLLKIYVVRRAIKDLEFLQPFTLDRLPTSANINEDLDGGNMILNASKSEHLFLSIPDARSAVSASRLLATHPHLAGSTEDFEDARVILELFQTHFGIPVPEEEPIFPAGSPQSRNATLDITSLKSPKAWIDVYYPIMNTGLDSSIDILDEAGDSVWSAKLEEIGDELDHEAAKYSDYIPTWHGLSKGGEVEGELIFANYGTKEDYDNLVATGANFTGKVVLVRYGEIFRGLKIKGAQELGAVGVIIYSDPRDDGVVTVENGYLPYPAGPARNPTSVQRGSVQFISMYPGDPTTPGYPAYENATRIEGTNKPSIPSLPVSWQNAQRLLEEIGPGDANRILSGNSSDRKIRLVNHVNDTVIPIWNTMAVIPGHIKDEVVMIGNHRDAWVMGAADPTSGTVSVHEIVRGFGALLRTGWKPLRTILIASWDAEEYGLIGSTEWAEDFPDWISDHVVTYLNVDVSVAGSMWFAAASPLLSHVIRRTAMDIPHPTVPGRTLWDAREDIGPYEGVMDATFQETHNASRSRLRVYDTGIYPLGSGSDFTVFLQRLGVASSDQSFAPTPNDAPYHYHSIYDSQRWQESYADPGFHRHVAVAKHLGLLALRIADSLILPLNTTQYALELDSYLDLVEETASTMSLKPDFEPLRKSFRRLQKASASLDKEKDKAEAEFKKSLEKMNDDEPKHPEHLCEAPTSIWDHVKCWLKQAMGRNGGAHKSHVPQKGDHVDESLWNWFSQAWTSPHGNISTGLPHNPDLVPGMSRHAVHSNHHNRISPPSLLPLHDFIRAAKRVRRANRKLVAFERGFISEEGIKDREWYRHLGVAPGKWLGYGATTLPAITEALTIEKNATLAEYEARRLGDLLDELSKTIAV